MQPLFVALLSDKGGDPRMIFLLKGTRLLPAGDTTPY